MEISYYISWTPHVLHGHHCNSTTIANGNLLFGDNLTDLKCQYGCSDLVISNMPYVCTDFSNEDDWVFGEHHITHTFTNISDYNTVTIGTYSGSWNREVGKRFNISTTFSLLTRDDTGKINSSPQVVPTFNLRLQQGCNYTIPLLVSDPDNDTIRCRWAVSRSECRSVCNKFPGALLDSISCTIMYTANYSTGLKAVAMMIEDFAPGSPNHPLSSVALQFLVVVFESNQSCSSHIECFKFPSIITHPSNEIVSLKNESKNITIILTCMANETSSYYWEREGGAIPIASIGVHTNTITLMDVQPEDSGNYRCVAFVCSTSNRSYSNYATVTVGKPLL